MIYRKSPSYIIVIAFLLIQGIVQAADPLDPIQMGESMDMGLPQELIQAGIRSGVITESNPLYRSESVQPSFSVVPPPESADAINSIDNANVTGEWSFKLNGKDPEQMKLHLFQYEDVVMGQGEIKRGNETNEARVSGSISGEKMSLTVMPVDVLNLYKLDLSLSSLASGTYIAYLANGSSRSGKVIFSVSTNIFKPVSTVAEDGRNAYTTADSAAVTPIPL